MIDVIHNTCMKEGCKKRPNFNYEEEIKALYCNTHKKDNMINVNNKNKICIEDGCKKEGIFNYENKIKGLYCKSHKKDEMVDVKNKNKICIYEGCKKRSNFNYENEKKALYCKSHKKNGMIDVNHNNCIKEGCKTQPTFNYKNKTKPIYCRLHKLDDMVDVINEMCIEKDCKKHSAFNYENQTIGIYCFTHKKNGMINVISKSCKNDWCDIQISNPKYEGYCLHCFMNMFPDKPLSKNYKTKEREVVQFIKSQFPNHSWISDKKVEDGCSKRRPDILCDLGYQVLIIEIDENQHIDYDCSCENKRIMEISQDINHRPLIFIRFNPDDYKKGDTNITSCWGIGKSGICSIKKNKKSEWEERLQTLQNQISYWLTPENQTNKTVEIIQLFYDE